MDGPESFGGDIGQCRDINLGSSAIAGSVIQGLNLGQSRPRMVRFPLRDKTLWPGTGK
jgi:hypothetical protein